MIPSYQELMRPVLNADSQGERKISEVVDEMADQFGLSDDERLEMLPSGKQTVIADRTHWARSYLKQAGLLKNTRRGVFEITDRGRTVLADPSIDLNSKYLERFEDFRDFQSRGGKTDDVGPVEIVEPDVDGTPDEELQAAHARLNKTLAANLLDQV